eukprot:6207185-Pleurochrysis_carterae.AAC.2
MSSPHTKYSQLRSRLYGNLAERSGSSLLLKSSAAGHLRVHLCEARHEKDFGLPFSDCAEGCACACVYMHEHLYGA